ncbi:MAG: DNA topoisomerase IB [Acidobacteriota bacterium]
MQPQPLFDIQKAKAAIERGRRAKWWIRKGSPKRGFAYLDISGKKLTDADQLERIRLLVIPPAWKFVRIAPSAASRIQAVGMDTTGRVQYIYDPKFADRQQRKKFSKIEKFGEFLPSLREITNEHIALEGFPKEKVLAVVMRLINSLYFRVGTEKSARHYKTYGITTLKKNHLSIGRKGELIFEYVGKSHIKHRKVIVDADLATLMKDLRDLGRARKLFHYLDIEGKPRAVTPRDVNEYLKNATAPEFSAKDFRTWGGTLLAAIELAQIGKTEEASLAKKNVVKAIKSVAEQLGNTPAVCRGSYVHPAVLSAYDAGITLDEFRPRKSRPIKRIENEDSIEEAALIKLMKNQKGK